MIQSFFGLPGESRGDGDGGAALGGDILLEGEPALGLDDVQPLAGLLVHHLEEGVLEDRVQLLPAHLELI